MTDNIRKTRRLGGGSQEEGGQVEAAHEDGEYLEDQAVVAEADGVKEEAGESGAAEVTEGEGRGEEAGHEGLHAGAVRGRI